MFALALRVLVLAHTFLITPSFKLTRMDRQDKLLADVLSAFQSSRNDVTFWTRERNETCGQRPRELAVHLSTIPNSGTTWTQFLFEEATGIITQRNDRAGDTFAQGTTCRAKDGVSKSEARLAMNDELELYKAHYPGLPGSTDQMINGMVQPQQIFVPSKAAYAISRSLVIIRNPIDAFFAIFRHLNPYNEDKVSQVYSSRVTGCTGEETATRTELIGEWMDPEGYNVRSNISAVALATEDAFRNYIKLWVRFVTYWFLFSSSACTDVTMVRYEDLSETERTLDTISVLINAFNSSVSSNAIERATLTYPPSASSTYNVYANASFDATPMIQAFASVCLEESDLMSALGYQMVLQRIVSRR